MKDFLILGGPNGAGKTTTAQFLLREELGILEFVNADEIARGLSPLNDAAAAFAAGRFMIERVQTLLRGATSFAMETTCSGRTHIRLLAKAKGAGWRVTLLFLWLPSPEAALDRVARRVREGGHSIPPEVVVRRYWAGLANLHAIYLPMADVAVIYDNSDGRRTLVAERPEKGKFIVHDETRWKQVQRVEPWPS